MRWTIYLAAVALAQPPDPAYQPLAKAYEALRQKSYDAAILLFEKAVATSPGRASIRKDLAYAYLKTGETEAARDQFAEAMRLDPKDFQAGLEYGFLCHETKQTGEARRVFDRIRKTGDNQSRATAETAFQNIDQPLAEGIARWMKVASESPDNFMAHYELAGLAEKRDDMDLAARHYERAWRILPKRKSILLDLGRVLTSSHRTEEGHAALVAATRSGEPRAAELARELLPERFPWVTEFRRAIALDPSNVELRRDLAFLLLRMDRQPEAEREFRELLVLEPGDLLSNAQLGFLYLARDERDRAMPLLERVLAGDDATLANKVRNTLRLPHTPGAP
ncbi:MAG: tetratricopeptide repeat protein, partial [Bryobacteraceae bacterium]